MPTIETNTYMVNLVNKLQQQDCDLVKALEKIERIAKDPNVRTKRTMLQMCSFFDDTILPIIDEALAQVGKAE